MKTKLGADGATLDLGFDSLEEARDFFAEARKQSSFFLPMETELKQFHPVRVTAGGPKGFRFRFDTEVMQVFPRSDSFGTAFGFAPDPKRDAELERKLGSSDDPNVSPAFKIRQMNPNEKFRLAVKASRAERQILLRDSSPQVLLGLLSHPQIEDNEVKTIVSSNYASGAILQRVSENRKWMSNAEIQLAVVRSPKTPPPLALKLLPSLRTTDLQVLAKGSMSRETIRRAALKIYLQRIKR